MKKMLSIATAMIIVLAVAVPAARADSDNAGAAALGFFLGAMTTSPRVAFGSPSETFYQPRARIIIPVPGERDHFEGHRSYRDGREHDRGHWRPRRHTNRSWHRYDRHRQHARRDWHRHDAHWGENRGWHHRRDDD